MQVEAHAATDVGNIKKVNEDNYFIDPARRLFAVADGVSGRQAGEVASKVVVDLLEEKGGELVSLLSEGDPLEDEGHRERVIQHMTALIQEANTAVYQLGKQPEYGSGMATTIVYLVLGPNYGYVAHVGDSRAYLARQDKIFRITEDHTYAEMLRKASHDAGGEMPSGLNKRFSHVLTRSIGGRPHVDVDVVFFELQPGDAFTLCSDGLTDYLTGAELLEYSQKYDGEEALGNMVHEAKERGGHDNITVVHVAVGEPAKLTDGPTQRLDTLKKINFLSEMTLFQDLSRVELLRMLRVVFERTYDDGHVVVPQGQKSTSIYIIAEGQVRLMRGAHQIALLSPGEHFGELSMFEEAGSTVNAVCDGEVVVLAIPLNRFTTLIKDELELGKKLLWNLMRQLARNVGRMNVQVDE